MKSIGSFAIYTSLYISLVGAALSFVAGRTGSRRFIKASRFAVYATYGSVAVAGSILLYALLTHDFSIQYVASVSDKSMPFFYLVGAFWGGQAGSLLFWVTIVGLFTSLATYVNRNRHQDFMPWVQFTCLLVMMGLLLILAFVTNPFEGFTFANTPTDGEGLNPLLQTPKMVLHPPALLTGLATMTVPFGFAMAALFTGNFSSQWVKAARKWILVPWLFLSVGNILGGMWAYEELGWGGYWAWDPVENAAFMPWLLATALIHSLMIQERRGMLKRWNVGLMIGTYLLTVFGTYITRSGLIESVHTFAQSDVGNYFLAFLLTATAISVGMFIYRWSDMEGEETLDSVASRESAFMLNNWVFVAMTVVVLFGTMWPKVKTWLTGQEVSIGPPWFNRWMIPLGIVLLLLMGVGTIIAWRKATLRNLKRDFIKPLIFTVLGTPAIGAAYWFLRGQDLGADPTTLSLVYAGLTLAGCIFVVTSMFQEFWRGARARVTGHDENPVEALFHLFRKQRRRYGGYVVHLGVICMFLAFSGNAFKLEKDVSLERGESVQLGDYNLTYKGLSEENEPGKTLYKAHMDVTHDGEPAYTMYPGKAVFAATPQMPTSEIDIKSGPLEDVYTALVNFDERGNRAAFKIFVNPFTWWFWMGGVVLVLGSMIAMWPTRESLESLSTPMRFGRLGAAGGLILVCLSPMVVWQVESDTKWGSAERWSHVEVTSETDAPDTTSKEPTIGPKPPS